MPKDWDGKAVLFEFEAVYQRAEVYINGEKAAFRPYGYTNFYVDAAKYLNYGAENEIRVIARNSDQPNSRWYSGTGMYRPAWIWLGDEAHIPVNGVRIRTVAAEPEAVIEVDLFCSYIIPQNGGICYFLRKLFRSFVQTEDNSTTSQVILKWEVLVKDETSEYSVTLLCEV